MPVVTLVKLSADAGLAPHVEAIGTGTITVAINAINLADRFRIYIAFSVRRLNRPRRRERTSHWRACLRVVDGFLRLLDFLHRTADELERAVDVALERVVDLG